MAKKKEHLFTVKLVFRVVRSTDKRYPTHMSKVLKALRCGCDVGTFQAFAQQLTVPISNRLNASEVYYSVIVPVQFEAGTADLEGGSSDIFRADVENGKVIDDDYLAQDEKEFSCGTILGKDAKSKKKKGKGKKPLSKAEQLSAAKAENAGGPHSGHFTD
jgi:hypothetical protein